MSEASLCWSDSVLLSHSEVLSEVLVSGPPVEHDEIHLLLSGLLMEIRISHIILLSISWEPLSILRRALSIRDHACSVVPIVDHVLLGRLHVRVGDERRIHLPYEDGPDDSDPVGVGERGHLPVNIAERILDEPGDVSEHSVLLSIVSGFSGLVLRGVRLSIGLRQI